DQWLDKVVENTPVDGSHEGLDRHAGHQLYIVRQAIELVLRDADADAVVVLAGYLILREVGRDGGDIAGYLRRRALAESQKLDMNQLIDSDLVDVGWCDAGTDE